jgi:hypothetical protein
MEGDKQVQAKASAMNIGDGGDNTTRSGQRSSGIKLRKRKASERTSLDGYGNDPELVGKTISWGKGQDTGNKTENAHKNGSISASVAFDIEPTAAKHHGKLMVMHRSRVMLLQELQPWQI